MRRFDPLSDALSRATYDRSFLAASEESSSRNSSDEDTRDASYHSSNTLCSCSSR